MADSPRGEEAVLVAVQSALADRPGVLTGARALSHFGEHSIGWLAVAALGALLAARDGDGHGWPPAPARSSPMRPRC